MPDLWQDPVALMQLLRGSFSFALFGAGWLCCAGAAARVVPRGGPAVAGVYGLLLWCLLIPLAAVGLSVAGLAHPWAFAVLPLPGAVALGVWSGRVGLVAAEVRDRVAELLGHPVGGMALAAVAALVASGWQWSLFYPTQGWDGWQYHRPISYLFLQEGRLWSLPVHIYSVNHFPKNGELISAWCVVWAGWEFGPSAQTVYYFLGLGLTLASGARVAGASRPAAAAVGLAGCVAPVVLEGFLQDQANVDLPFGMGVALGCVALGHLVRSGAEEARHHALAATAAGVFLMGMKANGVVPLLLFSLTAGTMLLVRTRSLLPSLRLAAITALLGLSVSSYWWIENWVTKGNPVWPARITMGETVVFPGKRTVDDLTSVGMPEEWKKFSAEKRLRRSIWQTDSRSYVYWSKRAGGWGLQFAWVGVPLLFVGALLALHQRLWPWWAMVLPALVLFLLTANNWWARYVAFAPAMAALAFVPLWRLAERRRLGEAVLGAYALSIAWGGTEACIGLLSTVDRETISRVTRKSQRHFPSPHQVFRAGHDEDDDRRFHLWIEANMPPGGTLLMGKVEGQGDGFPGLQVLPGGRSRFVEAMEDRVAEALPGATFVSVATGSAVDRAMRDRPEWEEAALFGRFTIFRRRAAAPPGS